MFVKTFAMNNTFVPIEILMDSRAEPEEVKRLTIRTLTQEEEYCTFQEVDLFHHSINLCQRETKSSNGLVFKISNN